MIPAGPPPAITQRVSSLSTTDYTDSTNYELKIKVIVFHLCYPCNPWLKNENGSATFSQRRTSATAIADGGLDSGDGESTDRFLRPQSDSAGPIDHFRRSARRIPGVDAGTYA